MRHLIIGPTKARQGIGSAIVSKIEKYAYDSTAIATSMVAIPVDPVGGGSFWSYLGYHDESARRTFKMRDQSYEVILYRKTLPTAGE